jgi:hypothetical protein
MGAPAEALPWYERLISEFEKSEYLERARKRVLELKVGQSRYGSETLDSRAGGNRR